MCQVIYWIKRQTPQTLFQRRVVDGNTIYSEEITCEQEETVVEASSEWLLKHEYGMFYFFNITHNLIVINTSIYKKFNLKYKL